MKKNIVIACLAVICLSLIGYSTQAFFAAEGKAANRIVMAGGVNVSIDVGTQTMCTVEPGAVVTPAPVRVRLEAGSADCWVRVKLVDELEDGKRDTARLVSLEAAGADWVLADGWYYCKTPLRAEGAVTGALQPTIHFDGPGMNDSCQGCRYRWFVNAQAVQYENNAGGVLAVRGWPAGD